MTMGQGFYNEVVVLANYNLKVCTSFSSIKCSIYRSSQVESVHGKNDLTLMCLLTILTEAVLANSSPRSHICS